MAKDDQAGKTNQTIVTANSDCIRIKILASCIFAINALVSGFLMWMALTPDPLDRFGISETVLCTAILATLTTIVYGWRLVVTIRAGTGDNLPDYHWYNRGFVWNVASLFVITLALWPGCVTFLFHSLERAIMDLYSQNIQTVSVSLDLTGSLVLHTLCFFMVLSIDAVVIALTSRTIAQFQTLEAVDEVEEDEGDKEADEEDDTEQGDDGAVIKITLPQKLFALFNLCSNLVFLVDLIKLNTVLTEANSGLVLAAVGSLVLLVWRGYNVVKYLRNKHFQEQWIQQYRALTIVHFIVVFVVYFVSLMQVVLLGILEKDGFFSATGALPAPRPIQIYATLSYFAVYTVLYAFILFFYHRGMFLADEIASLQLMMMLDEEVGTQDAEGNPMQVEMDVNK